MYLVRREDQIKLEYHRKVVEHLRRDESRVRSIGRTNIERMREQYRHDGWGQSGTRWLDLWQSLLDGPSEDLIKMCLRTDETGCDMRQVGPFLGVLTQDERLDAIRHAKTVGV